MDNLREALSIAQFAQSAYEEDYIKGRKIKGVTTFADLVRALGKITSDEEIRIVAQACMSVFDRRVDVLSGAMSILKFSEKPESKLDAGAGKFVNVDPLCEGDF